MPPPGMAPRVQKSSPFAPISVASNSIGLTGADVLSVSSKGELAVLLFKGLVSGPGSIGTLARVPLGGGTPREILEGVTRADWAPNGEDLAVVRVLANGHYRIEYPIGTVLLESALGDPRIRVSPNGDLLAFSDGKSIATIDRGGKLRVLSSGWSHLYHVAWSPRGDAVILSGSRSTDEQAVYAVSLSGRMQVLLSNSMGLWLHDVASDGRLLLEDVREGGGIACLARGEARERDLGRVSDPFVRRISSDGRFIVYTEGTDPGGVHFRRTDGEAPFRLGDGNLQDLSSDGRQVLLLESGPTPHLIVMPDRARRAKANTRRRLRGRGCRLSPGWKGVLRRGPVWP